MPTSRTSAAVPPATSMDTSTAEPVRAALRRLAAMRMAMREDNLGGEIDGSVAAQVGMSTDEIRDMYRLLALAKYDERYVIPKAHPELVGETPITDLQGACGFTDGNGCGDGCGCEDAPTRLPFGGSA